MNRTPTQRLSALRPSVVFLLIIMLFLYTVPLRVMADDGDLDGTFFGGTVITDFFGLDDIASAVAVQTDGKIVTAGFTFQPGSNFDFALARYNTDGTLDPDFSGGRIVTDFFGQFDMAADVAIQNDGKIVVVGQCFESFVTDSDFAIARYNSDGNPDMTFGTQGKVILDFFGEDDRATAVAIMPNGKIVVAGSARNGVFLDFAIARYNSDGNPDNTFGSGGKSVTDFTGTEDSIEDIRLQPDNKIVAVGSTFSRSTKSNFAIVRYKSNGDLDPSFAFGGKVSADFFGEFDNATCVDIQRDGKIVVAGNAEVVISVFPRVTGMDFGVIRYNSDGRVDKSFSSDGRLTTDFNGQQDGALSIKVQSDGKIIAAGLINPPSGFFSDFGLVRYNANGNLDTSFGSGGKAATDFLGSADTIMDIAIQRDGRIVAVGSGHDSSGLPNFALARYDGSLPTPQGSLEYLISDITYLVGTGSLTRPEGDSLILKLDSAIRKLDKGLSASVNVQSFINQMQNLISLGRLIPDQADPIINEATSLLGRIR